MGNVICTIKSWWEQQKENAQDFFETLYTFYTAPVEAEVVTVPAYHQQQYPHM